MQLSSRQESRPLGTQRLNGCYNLLLVLLESVQRFPNVFNACALAGCQEQLVFQGSEHTPYTLVHPSDDPRIPLNSTHISPGPFAGNTNNFLLQRTIPRVGCLSLDPFSLKAIEMSPAPSGSLGLDPPCCLRVSVRCSSKLQVTVLLDEMRDVCLRGTHAGAGSP